MTKCRSNQVASSPRRKPSKRGKKFSRKRGSQSRGNYGVRPLLDLNLPPVNSASDTEIDPWQQEIDTFLSPVTSGGGSSVQNNSMPTTNNLAAMLFFPSGPTEAEWNQIMAANRTGVALTGKAAMEMLAQAKGAIHITEFKENYGFRVPLPGIKKGFSCRVEGTGKVIVKGKPLTEDDMVPEFSITFWLPGPVNHLEFRYTFACAGILKGVVKKRPPQYPLAG